MTVKLYSIASSGSSRKAVKYLLDNNIKFVEKRMDRETLSWEQLFEILMNTENGVEDILSTRSNDYKELTKDGIDFEELSLTELYYIVSKHPKILKAPIMVAKGVTLVGYNDEEIETLNNRNDKKKAYFEVLNRIRATENKDLEKLKRTKHDQVVAG